MPIWKIDLAWISQQCGLRPRTVCECAVGPMEISIAPGFSNKCDRLLLVEPLPRFAASARTIPGAEVHQVAVGLRPGTGVLLDNNGSSFLQGSWAPTMDREPMNKLRVDIVTFDTLDDGKIDVLGLDCEGQEWAVLSKMRSRPRLLTVELWKGNPWLAEIEKWLADNSYDLKFSTGPEAETHLYARQMGKDS